MISVKNLKKEFKVKDSSDSLMKDMFYPNFKSVTAVEDISFEISKGESVAFLGPNGAGKTTTIKMMVGLLKPDGGEVQIDGHVPFNRDEKFLKNIGLVMGGKAGLDWDLTPRQSFKLLKAIYDLDQKEYESWLGQLVEILDLKDKLDKQVRKLSLGERMKCELIGSIIHKPKILFLDEPTVGLDIDSKRKIRSFLRKLQEEEGITLLLTSHEMDDVENVSDRVIIINKGVGVYDDDIKNLQSRYSDKKYIRIRFMNEMDEYPASKYIKSVDGIDVNYEVPSSEVTEMIQKVLEKGHVDDIDIMAPPLESIILEVFNE